MAVTCKCGTVPGLLKDLALEEGATIADAIREAGYDANKYRIEVDGNEVDLSDAVENGDAITLLKNISAG